MSVTLPLSVACRDGFVTAVRGMVSCSVLLEGIFHGLWVHPLAQAAIQLEGKIHAPLIQELSVDSLVVLLWYGSYDACKVSAAALGLPERAQFVYRVRETLTGSLSMHHLWSHADWAHVPLLLSHLTFQRAGKLSELVDGYISRRSGPWRHAVSTESLSNKTWQWLYFLICFMSRQQTQW